MGVTFFFQIYACNINKRKLNTRDNLILVTADKCCTEGSWESIAILNEQKPIVYIVFDEVNITLIAIKMPWKTLITSAVF